nr:MAG TPA: hypothetical protein [Ackermannviridae sp.]
MKQPCRMKLLVVRARYRWLVSHEIAGCEGLCEVDSCVCVA